MERLELKTVNKMLINAGRVVPSNERKAYQNRKIKVGRVIRCWIFTQKVWSDNY